MTQVRTVILIRHAKSAWGLDLPDAERPLSKRGRRDAAALGVFLADRKLSADLLIHSPAVRAVETWGRAAAAGARAKRQSDDSRVYEASAEELLPVLRGVPAEVRTLMVIGHGPAIPDLVELLAVRRDGPGEPLAKAWRRLDTKYPTSGCAVINTEVAWSKLRPGSAELESFDVPRGEKR